MFSWWNLGPSQTQYAWFDDFIWTNERPANRDAAGNYMIGPANWGGGGSPTFTVTPSAGANGSISPNTAQTVTSGATAQFTITPTSSYTGTVGGTCGGSPGTASGTFVYTTNPISAGCTVSATFAGDATPPTVSNPLPFGELPYATYSVTLEVGTSEAATCKYDASDVAYASMANTFSSTGGITHQQAGFAVSQGQSYTRYVRCIDPSGNATPASTTISFSVASTDDTIVDNNAATGTSQSSEWWTSTNFPGYYGANYHSSPGGAGHWFQWQTPLVAGTHSVYAWWSAVAQRPWDVAYEITHSGGTTTVSNVDQRVNGGQWNFLGTYSFGTTGTVRVLSGATGTYGTVADAIRFFLTADDTTAPSVPTLLSAYSTSTDSITLSWAASTDNVAVSQYRVRYCQGFACVNWSTLGTVPSTSTSITHSGITPSATPVIYRYQVRAEDAAGNVSVYPNSVPGNALPTLPAFPGAAGGGATAVGGRGGAICNVTNLNNSGAGSLRACVESSGPRTVIFRVGGTIEVLTPMYITEPFLTIAGQTAPGGGIQWSGKQNTDDVFKVRAPHVIIRYVRSRKGYNAGTPEQQGDSFGAQQASQHVIIDHSSFAWTQDDGGVGGALSTAIPKDITFSNSIFSEPLRDHPTLFLTTSSSFLGERITDIDIHRSFFTRGSHRYPLIKNKSFRLVNNILYNWYNNPTQTGGGVLVDVIGNLYKRGPLKTGEPWFDIGVYLNWDEPDCLVGNQQVRGTPSIYVSGNIGHNNPNPSSDNWPTMVQHINCVGAVELGLLDLQYRRLSPLPALPHPIPIVPADSLEAVVLPIVGASRRLDCDGYWVSNRDAVDARLITEYNNNQGTPIPLTEDDVGGFPTIAAGTACTDTDSDGMPDVWETANGLNINSSADANAVHASGYTNLEWYLAGPQSADEAAPTVHGLYPTGDLPERVTSVTLQVFTDEVAECRFGALGTAFGSMTAFESTNSTAHAHSMAVQYGGVYQRCYRCQDEASNLSAESCARFSVPALPKRRVLH